MKEDLSKFDKDQFAKAQKLSKEGNILDMLEIMKGLVESNPRSAIFHAVLANAYWETGDLETAEKTFRKAIEITPDSEKASLGLFHCLWEQNRTDEAFAEMKRFMEIADSEDYRAIVNEINESSD